MGQVYRARDERLGRDVALKVLHATTTADATRQRRFLQEARAAGSLTHPNILAVYDVGIDAGMSFIVTELVEGGSLRDELGRGRLPLARTLHLAVQIADGLTAAHRAGFVHRDLKPDNVMVTRAGDAKIVDFGLAFRAEGTNRASGSADATLTAPHVVLGTASYMSPEQARGSALDFRSDLFAFGAVLYEMLSGRRAFERPSVIETLSAVLAEAPTPVQELAPGCPDELARLVHRCLAKSPDDRYAATADLHHDLVVLRDGLRQPPWPNSSRRIRRWPTVTAGLAAIALVGATSWALGARTNGVDLSTYQLVPLATEAGYEGSPAWSPDGSMVAYVAEVDGVLQVMRRTVGPMGQPIESDPAVRLTDSPVDCRFPFWSADSSRVYFISQAREREALWSVSAALGGRREVVLENVNHAVLAPDGSLVFLREQGNSQANQGLRYALWIKPPGGDERRFAPDWIGEGTLGEAYLSLSPDGSRIALSGSPSRRTHADAGLDDVELWVFPYPSGPPRRVLQNLSLPRAYPVSWMPDNRHVVFGADFVGAASGARLWRADLDTGALEPLTATTAREYDPDVSPDGGRIAFTSDTSTFDLVEIPTDGSAPIEPQSSQNESEPVWASNGRQYVYVSNRNGYPEVWRADRADQLSHRVVVRSSQFTDGPTFLLTRLAVAPGGDRIVYQRRNHDGYYLWISMLAGGPAERLLTLSDYDYQDSPTWSPDGQWIAFTFARDRTWGLARMQPGDQQPQVIRHGLEQPCDPHWSPDGDHITCQQAQGLFLMTTDGQSRQVTDEVWLAHDWSDGRTLFGVRETDDLHLQLVRLDVPTRTLTVVNPDLGSSPPARMPLSGFSVSPDGTSILTSLVRLRGDVHLLTGFGRPRRALWLR